MTYIKEDGTEMSPKEIYELGVNDGYKAKVADTELQNSPLMVFFKQWLKTVMTSSHALADGTIDPLSAAIVITPVQSTKDLFLVNVMAHIHGFHSYAIRIVARQEYLKDVIALKKGSEV